MSTRTRLLAVLAGTLLTLVVAPVPGPPVEAKKR
jgi:hypothetical protein